MEEKVKLKRFSAYGGPERRKHKRIKRHFIGKFHIRCDIPERIPVDWNMVTLENLSAGGALFNYYKEIEIDTPLNMQINFPPSKAAIRCVGKVIRIEKPPRVIVVRIAAVFTKVGRQDREMINALAEEFYLKKRELITP